MILHDEKWMWERDSDASLSARAPHGMVMSLFRVDGIRGPMGIHVSAPQPLPSVIPALTPDLLAGRL